MSLVPELKVKDEIRKEIKDELLDGTEDVMEGIEEEIKQEDGLNVEARGVKRKRDEAQPPRRPQPAKKPKKMMGTMFIDLTNIEEEEEREGELEEKKKNAWVIDDSD